MSRKTRRLTPDEERLWKKVADTATPMHREPPPKPPFSKKKSAPEVATRAPYVPPRFQVGEKATAHDTAIPLPDKPVMMDRKAFTKMKRGKSNPEARLDLHGMTAATAHPALIAFLLKAHGDGKRLVLVITGKGGRDVGSPLGPRQTGVLRRQVPHWLELPPLRQIVLQTTEAHQRHGGAGALYVYLRR